jgi:hypothetical protein
MLTVGGNDVKISTFRFPVHNTIVEIEQRQPMYFIDVNTLNDPDQITYKYQCCAAYVTKKLVECEVASNVNGTNRYDPVVFLSMCALGHSTYQLGRFVLLQLLLTLCPSADMHFLICDRLHVGKPSEIIERTLGDFYIEPDYRFTKEEYETLVQRRHTDLKRLGLFYDPEKLKPRDCQVPHGWEKKLKNKSYNEDKLRDARDRHFKLWKPMVGKVRTAEDFVLDTDVTNDIIDNIDTIDVASNNNSVKETGRSEVSSFIKRSGRSKKTPTRFDIRKEVTEPIKQNERTKSKVIHKIIMNPIPKSVQKDDSIDKLVKRLDIIVAEKSHPVKYNAEIPVTGIKDLEYAVKNVTRLVEDSIQSRKDIERRLKVTDLENQLQSSRSKNEVLMENNNNQHVLEIVKTFCNTQCHVATVTSHFNPYYHGQNLNYQQLSTPTIQVCLYLYYLYML